MWSWLLIHYLADLLLLELSHTHCVTSFPVIALCASDALCELAPSSPRIPSLQSAGELGQMEESSWIKSDRAGSFQAVYVKENTRPQSLHKDSFLLCAEQ